jgi:hypothetical protein
MRFEFVENDSIRNEESRKLIRSHCMKGKNVGKTHKTRKARHRTGPGEEVETSRMTIDDLFELELDTRNAKIRSCLSDRFGSICFPGRLEPVMHELLYRCEWFLRVSIDIGLIMMI